MVLIESRKSLHDFKETNGEKGRRLFAQGLSQHWQLRRRMPSQDLLKSMGKEKITG